ncbi:MAG TPA: M56 family metallopeptidase [Steroidobacteraceae bacterium]
MALANHIWQSTLFAVALGCLTLLLRKNSARVRCLMWLAASAKFLVPFALLTAVGSQIPWPARLGHATLPAFVSTASRTAVQLTQLSGQSATTLARVAHASHYGDMVPVGIALLWALGALVAAAHWFTRWLTVRRALRESTPTNLAFVIPVRASTSHLEPAVVGILRPVLLLPAGVERHLAADEMEAVLAHERCHVVWRDNLAATVHMFVEALFWFHPLIWWLGTRMVNERERACDEQVLAQGYSCRSYAEGILKVCEHYLKAPLISVAGVGGARLCRRIEAIMKNRLIERLGAVRKVVLTLVASATIAIPVAIGILTSPHARAAAADAEAHISSLRNVSIKLAVPSSGVGGAYNAFGLTLQDEARVQTVYSLRYVIANAYGVDPSQVVGKDLSKEPVYEVTMDNPARLSRTATGEERSASFKESIRELPGLTRDLLATHFGLVVKREQRQMPGYVLTIGSGGSKLDQDSEAPFWKEGAGYSQGEIFATKAPIGLIVRLLDSMFRAPVVDQTGLKGTYDYKLTWPPSSPGASPEPATMAKALQEQLGLHLEPKPVTEDVINVVSLKSPAQILTAR